jgi:hypothetical protein
MAAMGSLLSDHDAFQAVNEVSASEATQLHRPARKFVKS